MRLRGLKRKVRLGRWLIIAMVVVVALGSLGVAYGYASGTLRAGDTMSMACFTGPFTWVVSNDDGTPENKGGHTPIDPGDDGGGTNYDMWVGQSSDDPSEQQTMGVACARYDKDVARTRAWMSCDRHEITVLIENAYPSYYPTVFFGLKNAQSFSVKIKSIDIIYDTPELTVTFDGVAVGDVLTSGQEVIGRLSIHTKQCAHQDSKYNVEVKVLVQEEESGCGCGWWGWWNCWNWWKWWGWHGWWGWNGWC